MVVMSYDSICKAGNEHLDDIPTGKNKARISKVSPFFQIQLRCWIQSYADTLCSVMLPVFFFLFLSPFPSFSLLFCRSPSCSSLFCLLLYHTCALLPRPFTLTCCRPVSSVRPRAN